MKRDELIAQLQELPEDAEFFITTSCGCCEYDEYDLDVYQVGYNSNKYKIA